MGDVAALTWPLTRPGGLLPLPSNRVRRCLFGPLDHERAKVDLEEHMRKMLQQDKLRWNFDFEAGKPLPSGRYQWERVGGGGGADPSDPEEGDAEQQKPAKQGEQTRVTDYMRKRKSSNLKDAVTQRPKTRRRSST